MVSARHNPYSCQRQTGAALVMGLVLLFVLTMMGITGIRSTIQQERMSGAFNENTRAFAAAEAAIRRAEWVLRQAALPTFNGNGLYPETALETDMPDWLAAAVDTSDAGALSLGSGGVAGNQALPDLDVQPQFFIQQLPEVEGESLKADEPAPTRQLFRIIARGFGPNPVVSVVIESTFER